MTKARGWAAFGLGAGAVAWSLALVGAAFTVPAYSGEGCQVLPGGVPSCGSLPSQTLFDVNGWWVVELLAAVAFVAAIAIALWALHVRCFEAERIRLDGRDLLHPRARLLLVRDRFLDRALRVPGRSAAQRVGVADAACRSSSGSVIGRRQAKRSQT